MSEPAIVGLGCTPMSLVPGALPLDLAYESVGAAIADAGIGRNDVDGLFVNSSQGLHPERLGVAMARSGGFGDLRLLEHVEIKGATPLVMIQHAVLAVRAGMASVVVCVFADAPLQPGGTSGSTYAHSGGVVGVRGLERVSGVLGSVPTYAMLAARYFDRTGGSEEDLGAVACVTRSWAVDNPQAVIRAPLSVEEYLASRMVASPLRLFDCARPVNGAVAVVVAAPDAVPSDRPAIHVRGMSQWHPLRRRRAPGESWFGSDAKDTGACLALDEALAEAGRHRSDIDVLEVSDPFTVVTLCLLEHYGFCGWGEGGAFVRSGATGPGGVLPTNTGGGQLSGFYLQGMTPLVEGIIQLRGAGGDRQVPDATTALVAAVGGRVDHHAFLVLDREPR